jgi:Type II CAAX prenyl endopeptidase Rce1-like
MKHRAIPARLVTDPALRRLFGWETWLVLALFPLPATLAALAALASHIASGFAAQSAVIIPNEPVLSAAFAIAVIASEVSAAAMVLYLLVRSGEGITAIGLGGHRLRLDLALVMPVWLLAQVIPQSVGASVVRSLSLPTFHVSSFGGSDYLLVALVGALVAGVLEEVVVLGYLVRRLEQRGWSVQWIVVVAVAIRVSYHLYYGPGVVPIVFWATASVLLYLRIRRLLPFIICHVAWDVRVGISAHSASASLTFGALFFLASLIIWFRWRKWHPAAVPLVAASRVS